MLQPQIVAANQPADRFYAGGAQIAELRGEAYSGGNVPEDWVASTTCLFGEARLGLSTLPDGTLLKSAVEADPEGWLGADHVAAYGVDTKLLTKLLDTGQRLLIHVHPDGEFAAKHLGTKHGKTEAWGILTPGEVFLGFAREVSAEELRDIVDRQDIETLLGAMHRFEVKPGDAVLVPAGTPHGIGDGILLVEVQEPEDLSIMLEWAGFDIDGPALGHLGLGFDLALQAVDRTARSHEEVGQLIRHSESGAKLPSRADEFFRLDAVRGGETLAASFGVLIVLEGSGQLGELAVKRGDTVVIPHGVGDVELSGDVAAYWCRPPQA